jgi:hypothetical protein
VQSQKRTVVVPSPQGESLDDGKLSTQTNFLLREHHAFCVKSTRRNDFSREEKPGISGKFQLAQAMR